MLFDKYFPSPALETIASWLLIYLAFDNEIPAILIANDDYLFRVLPANIVSIISV
jgi:hypothetical protein